MPRLTLSPRDRLEAYRSYLTLLANAHLGGRLRAKVDADDIVQETFVAALTNNGFRGTHDGELLAWLRQILASRIANAVERFYGTGARDVRRELDRTPSATSSTAGPVSALLADLSTPSQCAQKRERAALVAAALAALAPDHRDVLVLRSLEGLTFPEIAETMGRSVGAVTMLWARAVRQFRLALPEEP